MTGKAVSRLHIALSASSAAMKRPLDAAFKYVADFVERSKKEFAQFRSNLFAGIAQGIGQHVAQTFGSAIGAVGTHFEQLDELGKKADLIGIATEKLTAYRHAAKHGGMSADQLDTALSKLTRRLAEAAQGSGEALNSLERLGLDARELSTLTADQQLRAVADAMEQITTAGDRAYIASKLFDDEAQAMATILRGGSAALDAAEASANKLGLAISRVDAAQIEAANDAMLDMGTVWDGLTTRLTIGLAPLITAIGTSFVGLGVNGSAAGDTIAGVFTFAGHVIARISDVTNAVIGVFKVLQGIVLRVFQSLVSTFARLDDFTGIFGGALSTYRDTLDAMADDLFAEAGERFGDAFRGKAGNAFLANMEDARRQAREVAEAAAERLSRIEIPLPEAIEEAVAKAEKTAAKAAEKEKKERTPREATAGALERGTAAAFSAVRQAQRISEEIQLARRQLKEQQDTNRLLHRLASHMEANALAPSSL